MASENKIIVGLDIGTTKMCAIVGQMSENGKINVLGMGKTSSQGGVERGMVANINKAVEAIKIAVEEAQRQSHVNIKTVFVGIAGHHIKSMQHRGSMTRKSAMDEITQAELDKMEAEMEHLALEPGLEIIHILPQEYRIDGEGGIFDPVGRMGSRVECNYHIVTGQTQAAKTIITAVQKAGLEVADLVVEPFASASAVLTPQEMEAGVALVDIGGGTTDICIFENGVIRHTAIITMGGNLVTRDIQEAFGIQPDPAEFIKVAHGSCFPMESMKSEVIVVPGLPGRKNKEISKYSMAQVIQARILDIIEAVDHEIELSGLRRKLVGGIVLTGGGSAMSNINQLFTYHTGLEINPGVPSQKLSKGLVDEVRNPMYSTAVGLVLRGFDITEKQNITSHNAAMIQPEIKKEKSKTPTKNPFSGIKDMFSGSWGKSMRDWLEDGDDFNKE